MSVLTPSRWPMVPLKHLAQVNERTLPEDTDPDFEFDYIDIGLVDGGRLMGQPERMNFAQAPSRARRLVRQGETIVSTVRTYLRAVWPVSGDPSRLVVSTGFAVISPGNMVASRFMSWWLQSDPFVEEIVARSVGVSYPAINPAELGSIRTPIPPLYAQKTIADFLDAETVRIDALIVKKSRLIELLLSRRTVTTIYSVSGKLTSTDTMAPSSLPWLEELPAAWDEVLLRLVARLGSGHTPSRDHSEWWLDCTIPWITTGEVQALRSDRVEYIDQTREKISEIGLANSAAELHPEGTVVLCRTAASAGYSGIMSRAMATSQDFATWVCGPRLRPRFLLLCLRAMREDLLDRLAVGSTHKTIYMPDVGSIRIPLPPIEEQDRIAEAAWRELRRIDKTATLLEQQIALLRERRQVLITAAVTGKMEVSGVRR